jgi:ATP-dependent DNA helicase RecQ
MIDAVFQRWFSGVGSGVRPTQRRIIQSVLDGKNTLGLMPTGSGKSLCYWVAGKALGGVTLVVFPLTALMDEQASKLRSHGCSVFVLHSQIDGRQQYRELIDLYNQTASPDFIFVSPERLATDGFLEFVLSHIRDRVKLIVVDEAHCISQWGLDFRPFYKEIPYFLDTVFAGIRWPLVLALTATLNPRDRDEICQDLRIAESDVIRHDDLLRHGITLHVTKVPDENTKDEQFWDLLEEHRDEKALIYVDRKGGKRSTETLCLEALRRGMKAAYFHGDLGSDVKADIIQRFRSGDLLTVFATSAFGMGIDIPDIRHVVHYLLTDSTEQYYQQVGRVGRDGLPSWAELYYSEKNIEVRQKYYIERSFPTSEQIAQAYKDVTDGRIGRRTLNYFEEGEATQKGYHYLLRSEAVSVVCKGVRLLDAFQPAKGVALPEFERYQNASYSGLLGAVASKLGISEETILDNLYHWLAERRLVMRSSPAKCLVLEVHAPDLPDDLLESINTDVEEKKTYRIGQFAQFVELLHSYTDSPTFHMRIGEYLGVDKFSVERRHQTLKGEYVRSKSEVIIANILYHTGIPYTYEQPLYAPSGLAKYPDFTIEWRGKTYYWEHLGMLNQDDYAGNWESKKAWYAKHFPDQLITTEESSTLSRQVEELIRTRLGVEPQIPTGLA